MATQHKNAGLKDVVKQVQPMVESLAGFVVGNLAINMANKLLKIDPTDSSQKTVKKALPPLMVSTGALFGSAKVEQPMLKNVLQGAAIAGAYKTARALMPAATFLAGDEINGLGLSPVSAVSNPDRWLYHEQTPVSGVGFPDLGMVQPPEHSSGYYIDAPSYMGNAEPLTEEVYQPQSEAILLSGNGINYYPPSEELGIADTEEGFNGDDDPEML